jgi:MSHA biogenesis protein MshQ
MLALLLTATPAQAIDYYFPPNGLQEPIPAGCVVDTPAPVIGGAYTCGALTLAAGDTFTINAPKPATIRLNGAFSTGASVMLNAAGNTSDLTLIIDGAFTLGANSMLNANVQTINAGAVTIAAGSWMSGSLSTETGAVTIGGAPPKAGIGGTVSTIDGYVSIGAGAVVGGAIHTLKTGYVSTGVGALVNGDIVISGTGYVSTGAQTTVNGSMSTAVDGMTLGANTKVSGSMVVSQSGAVTLGDSAEVGGNISTEVGATTVGENVTVGGQISMNNTGAINIGANAKVYAVCCYNKDASCVTNGSGILSEPLVCVGSGGNAANFDCLETANSFNNVVSNSALRNPIYTKRAGTTFTIDISALNSNGSIETTYAADANKNITLELVDGTGNSVCASRSALSPAVSQSLTFTKTDAGRKTASLTVNNAYPNLRCRVTDASEHPSVVGCSSDNFSVRPSAVSIVTSASATPASAMAVPAIKAGVNFNLQAITSTGTNYAGSLSQDLSKLLAQTPAQDSTAQSGGTVGILTPFSLSANSAAVNATYSEVGYVYLTGGAYSDELFTAVDSAVGDCITNITNNNNLSDTLISSMYGCHIGNITTASLGRYYPHHFAISLPLVTAACTVSTPFTYFGEDGINNQFTLTAQNAANNTTQNYAGVFAKFNPTHYASYAFSAAILPAGASLASSTTAPSGSWFNGAANISAKHQISRPTAATAETAMTISAAPSDGEVTPSAATAVGAPTNLRYGRLKMKNSYGSELLALPMPLEAQYWNGTSYIKNLQDSCTKLPLSSIAMSNFSPNLDACETQLTYVGGSAVFSNGVAQSLQLTKPGINNNGSVDLTLNLNAASGSTCVSSSASAATSSSMPWFGTPPSARATFGVYKSPLIYMRENY